MARETTVEVDIEVSTKYTEKVKKAEERVKRLNKAASKTKTPKKPLTEMEKYQQSVNRTYRLLQKLEKQQKNIGKLTQIETTLKASVKVTIKDSDGYRSSEPNENGEIIRYTENSAMNIDAYLVSICNSLRIGNHNNLLWNVLNNIVLNRISDALVTTNNEIISLREELSNRIGDMKNTSTEAKKSESDDVVSDFLNILGTLGVFAGTEGVLGAVGSVAGPVGAAGTLGYVGGKYANKFSDFIVEKAVGERVIEERYPSGLEYIFTPLRMLSRVSKTENVKTGEITKYNWWGTKKEGYNPNTGVKKNYGWLNNVKSEENIGTLEKQAQNFNFGEIFAKSAEKLNIAADIVATKVGISSEELTNATTIAGIMASKVDGDVSNLSNATTGLFPSILDTTSEELSLIQASSTENMNALALLWDNYLQKVSLVYDMIILTMTMKHMLMTMNTLLTILNLYLTWLTLPPMLEIVWQQILGSADAFLSNLKSKFATAIAEIKQQMAELSSISINLPSSGKGPGNTYTGSNFWRGGLTYVGERGRELIQYPTGERFMADAKMLMNLPKGTKIFRNFMTERMMNNGFSESSMTTMDENNQLKKLGGFNGLSDYTDSKFGGGISYSSVKADNITINITNTYGNQSPTQIKDTNSDLVRKINDVLFQKEDRKRRVSIG